MIEIFGNKEDAKGWFYSSLLSFDWKRPYDYCKEGKVFEVGNELGRIEHGILS